MDVRRKPKGHENFYIDLNPPPGSLFTDGDIVSGKCVLLSTHDEDVGSVIISFHGIAKARVDTNSYSQSTQVPNAHYASEDVLFSETKTLYQGTYKLRKNTLYEWPFEFQFPNLLPPSGSFGGGFNGAASISYELKACRGRTWQDPHSLERHINPRSDIQGAPFQPSGLFSKIGGFTGMIAVATLPFVPPRPRRVEPNMVTRSVALLSQMKESPAQSFKRQITFHVPIAVPGGHIPVTCDIVLELPRNLIRGSSIPIRLHVSSDDDTSLLHIYLESVKIHLTSHTTIRSSNERHNIHASKIPIFSGTRRDIALPINSCLDIGAAFNIQLDPKIIPTFAHGLIWLSYDLTVNLELQSRKKTFKEEFFLGGARVLSDRIKSSPLSQTYFCSFTPLNNNKLSSLSNLKLLDEKGTDVETAETTDLAIPKAYFALCRCLDLHSIPHELTSNRNGKPTILLVGRAPSYTSSSQQFSAAPLLSSNTGRPSHESFEKDQMCLDTIIEKNPCFRAISLPKKGRTFERQIFAYLWTESIPEAFSSDDLDSGGMTVRLEMYDAASAQDEAESSALPSYTQSTDQDTSPFSALKFLNANFSDAANADPTRWYEANCIEDVLYVIHEYEKELRDSLYQIDVRAARVVASRYEVLREPLLGLGILQIPVEKRRSRT